MLDLAVLVPFSFQLSPFLPPLVFHINIFFAWSTFLIFWTIYLSYIVPIVIKSETSQKNQNRLFLSEWEEVSILL